MRCADCKFWNRDEGPFEVGRCHRYAPRPVVVAGTEEGEEPLARPDLPVWPLTIDEDWCGEFIPKHEATRIAG
jgi:hypothetical protein